ncbi:hypothetical protein D3C71_958280 [compost metagenome]
MRLRRSQHTKPLPYDLALGQSLQVSDVPVVRLVPVYWPAGMPSQTSFLLNLSQSSCQWLEGYTAVGCAVLLVGGQYRVFVR